MMKTIFLIFILFFELQAHQLKENYLRVSISKNSVSFSLEVETRLLENESFIDDNDNGIVSHKELREHQAYILSYVLKHIKLSNLGKNLTFTNAKIEFHRYQDQTYMQVNKEFKDINIENIVLKYDMFFDLESTHKLLIHLSENRGDFILDKNNQKYHFMNYKMKESQRFYMFSKSGVSHILDGFDHLLFVLLLLLPSLMLLKGDKKTNPLRQAFVSVVKIITIFSLAYSLSLAISALGLWTPNIKFVESSIALSIVLVSMLTFKQKFEHLRGRIVFFFGLLHGFGFANVLEIAQIKNSISFVVALFGFNVGVEIGQVFVILLLLPFLYIIAKTEYTNIFIETVSLLAFLLSLYWFLQRAGFLWFIA